MLLTNLKRYILSITIASVSLLFVSFSWAIEEGEPTLVLSPLESKAESERQIQPVTRCFRPQAYQKGRIYDEIMEANAKLKYNQQRKMLYYDVSSVQGANYTGHISPSRVFYNEDLPQRTVYPSQIEGLKSLFDAAKTLNALYKPWEISLRYALLTGSIGSVISNKFCISLTLGCVGMIGGYLYQSRNVKEEEERFRVIREKSVQRQGGTEFQLATAQTPNLDRRTEISGPDSLSKFPYNTQGWIQMKFPDGYYLGTGTLIGSKYVLTAAHNVYDRINKTETTSIIFGIGNKPRRKAGHIYNDIPNTKARIHFYPEEYKKISDEHLAKQHDFALLALDSPLGGTYGWMGLSELDLQTSQIVNVSGYPAEYGGNIMYTMGGHHMAYTPSRIFYDLDTTSGQSGGGVWQRNGEEYSCVAVHAYGRDERYGEMEGKFTSGTYLGSKRATEIAQYLK